VYVARKERSNDDLSSRWFGRRTGEARRRSRRCLKWTPGVRHEV